jgi:dihydrofolate reductase
MVSSLTVDLFVSVDGWAGSDGLPGYFGYLGPELEEWVTTELAAPQRVVMGRRTYEVLAGPTDQARDESSNPMAQLDTVVFSRTLQQVAWPNARVCSGDLVEEIQRMKADSDVPLRTMGSLSIATADERWTGGAAAADDLSAAGRGLGARGWFRRRGVGRSRAGRPPGPRWPGDPRGVPTDWTRHSTGLSIRRVRR